MRAVILGTDFIKDTDGSFKAIETNTNVGLSVDAARYMDLDSFTSFVESGSFDEITVIYTQANIQIFNAANELEPENSTYGISLPFYQLLKEYYSGSSVIVNQQVLTDTAVTIPNVTDSETKLIIRIAYDATALIDDTYARDNWEFLKLMNDSNPNSIPKTYIDDVELGFDSIGNVLRDNGNHPNYCIKKRITPTNNNVYPKLLKISTIQELDLVKSNLESDEYIQEYIFNPSDLLNNKTKVYRSVDMLYGGELDVINLWMCEQTNILDTISTPDYDDNNEIQIWDRNRYTTKYNAKTDDVGIKFSADAGTKILDTNDAIVYVQSLNVNDLVKSIDFPNIQYDAPEFVTMNWTGSSSDIINQSYVTSSKVASIIQKPYFGQIIEFELDNGSVFSDVPHATILTEQVISGSTLAKFSNYSALSTGSTVFVWDNDTNTMHTGSIINLYWSYQQLNAYSINLNQFDLFLTLEESSNNRYGLVTHNYDYDCKNYTCPGYSTAQYIPGATCQDCWTGQYVPTSGCTSVGNCCRYGPPLYFTPGYYQCQYWVWGQGCSVGSTQVTTGGFCNGNKLGPSDIELKKTITYIGTTSEGIKLYTFQYTDEFKNSWKKETGENLDGEWTGVMAQDLIGTKYESAIKQHHKGFWVVNYNKLPDIESLYNSINNN
jgi:hypothetical protein